MKPRTLDWLGATAAAAAALLCWHLLTMEPDPVSRVARRGPAAAGLVTGRGLTATPPLLRRDSPGFERTLLERGLPWLDARGRDAAGLIAMWDLTSRGGGLLMEAQENFSSDPRVCMAMIQYHEGTTPLWTDRLIDIEPDNPEGYLQKSRLFASEGDNAAAFDLLRQAREMNAPRNDHLTGRLRTAHEAALALGVSPGDAARLALVPPLQNSTTLHSNYKFIMEELTAAQASGSAERLTDIIQTGLLVAEKFDTALTVRDEMLSNVLQANLLASLPSGAQLPHGASVAQWSREVTLRREYLQESLRREAEADALLATASDEDITSYFLCFTGYGEEDARSFFLPDEKPKK